MNIKQANTKSKNAGHAVRSAVIEGASTTIKVLGATSEAVVDTAWLCGTSITSFVTGCFTAPKAKRVVRSAKH